MKNCTQIMNQFLELDKNQRIPLKLTLHLLLCKKCRTQVRMLTKAEKIASEPLKVQVPLTDNSIEAVLRQINPQYDYEESKSPISLGRWIVSGAAMVCLMLLFGILTRGSSSQALLISFYLLFAGVVTAYCAFFVGCNMDFFVKKIETMKFAL